jgi:predicted ATPase
MRSQDGYGEIATARHNLPADIASFIGREKELAEIARLLTTTRLLTLTGAGGSGKTRLAQRAAVDAVRTFSDGVWLVQFAPVTDGASLPRRIMTVLGIRGLPGQPLLGTLAASLASRHLLLLLDNCEHLIGACARLVETLLQACPHLHLLATSREPLRVPGETTWRVPPLTLPDKADVSTASLAQVEAVALFVDRARARRPDFALTDANAPTIATICSKVEGLPLGIELAAARIVALTPEQIVERLGDSLNVLSGGSRVASRHETLRGTLAWSDALLSEPERTLFRRLAVFAESFDLLAAEAVCSGGEIERAAVLDLLSSLVEKSLVEPSFRGVEAR